MCSSHLICRGFTMLGRNVQRNTCLFHTNSGMRGPVEICLCR